MPRYGSAQNAVLASQGAGHRHPINHGSDLSSASGRPPLLPQPVRINGLPVAATVVAPAAGHGWPGSSMPGHVGHGGDLGAVVDVAWVVVTELAGADDDGRGGVPLTGTIRWRSRRGLSIGTGWTMSDEVAYQNPELHRQTIQRRENATETDTPDSSARGRRWFGRSISSRRSRARRHEQAYAPAHRTSRAVARR